MAFYIFIYHLLHEIQGTWILAYFSDTNKYIKRIRLTSQEASFLNSRKKIFMRQKWHDEWETHSKNMIYQFRWVGLVAEDEASPDWIVGAWKVWQAWPLPPATPEGQCSVRFLNRGGVSILVMSSMFSYEVLLLSQPQHKWKTAIGFPHKLTPWS